MLQIGYSMPPAAVPGVTSTKLYACYSKPSAYDRPWRTANDVLAVRLLSNLPFACKVRGLSCQTCCILALVGVPTGWGSQQFYACFARDMSGRHLSCRESNTPPLQGLLRDM